MRRPEVEALPWYESRRLLEGLHELEDSAQAEDDDGMGSGARWEPDEAPSARAARKWRPDELEDTPNPDVWRVKQQGEGQAPAAPRPAGDPREGALDDLAALGITTRKRAVDNPRREGGG